MTMEEKQQIESKSKPSTSNNFKQNKTKNNKKRFLNENYSMKKRPAPKIYQRDNDIYVTNKSNFKAQLNQCEKILNSEIGEVYLHCLGNAISRGINLGLKLEKNSNGVYGIETNTSTIELIDDFHPLRDDDDYTIQKRLNSCLHIRIYRYSKISTPTIISQPSTSSNQK